MFRAWALLAVLQGGQSVPPVVVSDPGPGPVGRYLAAVLARPDTRVVTGDTIVIARDATYPGSVVVLASRVVNDGAIGGNLIVVGGDLFLHPNSRVGAQAIAIGGGVYSSLLAETRNGSSSYRDFTFVATKTPTAIELRYADLNAPAPAQSQFSLPGWLATRIPIYDRSNGLSASLGGTAGVGSVAATALGTYRSQLGVVDPSLNASWQPVRKTRVDLFAGRDTRSNESWITSDFTNSLNTIFAGHDTRNYYRADAVDLTVTRTIEVPAAIVAPRIGARYEKASSARPPFPPASHPWSFTDRNEPADEMTRLNPAIPTSRMTSAIVGTTVDWPGDGLHATLDSWVEVPFQVDSAGRFTQATLDGQVTIPTIGKQRFRFDAHGVLTLGDTAPRQRWAYVGGSGTLSTMDSLLTMGGGELLFMEGRYVIPVERIRLPFVGSPILALRYMVGSAGPVGLPTMTQIAGVRLSLSLLRAEYLHDLTGGHSRFHVDLALVR
jgi:hypothetical protein